MRIITVKFKNFKSYGNVYHTINFDNLDSSIVMILGENGAGKSTIKDVIDFGFFGKLDDLTLNDSLEKFEFNKLVTKKPQTQKELDSIFEKINNLK